MATLKHLRRMLSNRPAVYELGALLKLACLKCVYSGHDAIASVLLCPGETGVVVDVGANRGQSAIRLANLRPRAEIISFEPNPRCLDGLKFTRWLLRSHPFSYYPYGISDRFGDLVYYEPCVNALPVSAEGTFCRENLDDELEARIGAFTVRETRLPVRTLDSFNLSPTFLKIDVQGSELNVLRGARETIARSRPVILVERNRYNEADVRAFMSEMGYRTVPTNFAEGDTLFAPQAMIPELESLAGQDAKRSA